MISARNLLYDRLRRPPCKYSVKGSLPVIAFGDLWRAKVATVGLNPSLQEYLSKDKSELDGAKRRFETLTSLGAASRDSMSDDQCERVLETMRCYFQPDKPVYAWFRGLDRVLKGMGFQYEAGSAAHLDLVQEATDPTWSKLQSQDSSALKDLKASDLPFLKSQIESFELQALLCNGRTAFDETVCLLHGRVVDTVEFGSRNLKVTSASAEVGTRTIAVFGWNMPLARAGLTKQQDTELGELLANKQRGM